MPELARVQAWRVARHPALLLGLLWYVLGVGLDGPAAPYDRYSMVTAMLVFLLAVPAYFAVNLVATSGRRSGVDEWTGALPMPPLHRTVAMLLAAAAPAVIAAVASLGWLALHGGDTGLPLLWQHVASPPAAILGAGLLGVAVARLLPWPGLPLVAVVAVVTANAWVSAHWPYLGAYVDFVRSTGGDAIPAREPGSAGWHLGYLLALCALAAAGALLPVARRPWLPFAAGALAGVVVLVAGSLQLP
ncbi:MAG: hypothetical protein ABI807_06265 [Sporichthyaceae bacterium]